MTDLLIRSSYIYDLLRTNRNYYFSTSDLAQLLSKNVIHTDNGQVLQAIRTTTIRNHVVMYDDSRPYVFKYK